MKNNSNPKMLKTFSSLKELILLVTTQINGITNLKAIIITKVKVKVKLLIYELLYFLQT